MKYWCAANLNLVYFIELTTALECQKQLLMSSILNLCGRESLENAVKVQNLDNVVHICYKQIQCAEATVTYFHRIKN